MIQMVMIKYVQTSRGPDRNRRAFRGLATGQSGWSEGRSARRLPSGR
jgi:hypothetical protein